MNGRKADALVEGRSLLDRAVGKLRSAGLVPVVCARAGTELPPTDARVIRETGTMTAEPHPLRGAATALEALGEPAVLIPVDLPLLPVEAISDLARRAGPLDALATIRDGQLRYAALVFRAGPQHAPALRAAAERHAGALRTLETLGAQPVDLATITEMPPEMALTNVNDRAQLAEARRLLAG